ncbi:DUF4097 family beta strand repeat-containing protein [Halolactibacillus halophilus]|uniref:DUF4097 domain-containing protein n=1 Tax=Halolactibacillus halophilus TaxID=306540 RepID=A0ABQ0VJQ2_9BACI|nr:DUF4097 family beta strand repeat-containing protein [Halolactibacillus halophilus]GEM01368.1 hypothetical protein HHA03_09000 [Halolactibacillus halophilus]
MKTTMRLGLLFIILGISGLYFFGAPFTSSSGETTMNETDTINDTVADIYIEASAGSLIVEPSSDDDIHILVSDKDTADLSVQLESERLSILLDQDRVFNLSRFNLFGSHRPQLIITLPEEVYNQLNIKLAVGDIDIDGVQVDSLTAKNNVGAVTVSQTKTDTASVEINIGQISVSGGMGEWLATTDIGEVDLQLLRFEEDITAEVALGAINIMTETMPKDYNITLDVDLGEIQTEGLNTADVDTIQVWQSRIGTNGPKLDASVDLGQISLEYH